MSKKFAPAYQIPEIKTTMLLNNHDKTTTLAKSEGNAKMLSKKRSSELLLLLINFSYQTKLYLETPLVLCWVEKGGHFNVYQLKRISFLKVQCEQ